MDGWMETHMSNEEHNKLKRFGYLNSFYSSCKNSRKRGASIKLSNSLNFNLIKEKGDKEGGYISVKGKPDNVLVTFARIYVPPESDGKFFAQLLVTFIEGILVCAGDWNTLLNYALRAQTAHVKES